MTDDMRSMSRGMNQRREYRNSKFEILNKRRISKEFSSWNFGFLIFPVILLVILSSELSSQTPDKTHSFRLRTVELRTALDSLIQWYSAPLIYLDNEVAGTRVDAECYECSFEEALQRIIGAQGFTWKKVGDQMVIQKVVIPPSTVGGTVRDSLTGEGVFGADVLLLKSAERSSIYRWCSTNQFGFFSLRNIPAGEYLLQIRRLGYRTTDIQLIIPEGRDLVRDFSLSEHSLPYPEVTIEGRRSAFSALEGISRGVYVRATPSDHNQYLLEGARIYNPLHFGGVMSTFNGDAVRDVQMIAAGVPPYYGGRIGGIMDVSLRDGTGQGLEGSASVGSLSSSLVLEGPLTDHTSFMISGRRAYPEFFLRNESSKEKPSDLNSTEITGKLTHQLSDNQRLSFSGFVGRDRYRNSVHENGSGLANSLRWENAAANVRWSGIVSPALFFFTSAIYTRYGFDVHHNLLSPTGGSFVSEYSIEDIAFRGHAEYFYDEYHTVLAGVELVRHRITGRISEFSNQIAPMSLEGLSPWELSLYLQDQWRLVPTVLAELGARATSFIAREGSFSAVDPRFSLLISLRDDLRFTSSFSAVNQFIHPYRNSGIFLFYPSIFLYPSNKSIPPSTSLQVSLGMEKNSQDRYRLAIEGYYRTTQNLHEFVFDSTKITSLSDALILGEGDVYGIELALEKRLGDVTWTLRYTFSWADNQFDELNAGKPFQPRFDRRHELFANLMYSPGERWTFEGIALLSSNEFLSLTPREIAAAAAQDDATLGPRAGLLAQYAEPIDLNGGRLPGFQRLELRVQYRFSGFGLPIQTTLRLLNGYGLVDPFVWELRQNSDARLRWRARFDAPPLFPLYPVLSVGIRFSS